MNRYINHLRCLSIIKTEHVLTGFSSARLQSYPRAGRIFALCKVVVLKGCVKPISGLHCTATLSATLLVWTLLVFTNPDLI